MDFNVSKCFSLKVTLNRNIIHSNYHVNGLPVENVDSCKYLGVHLSSKMQWNKAVDHMIGKANKTLELLKRNLSSCSSHMKEKLYLSLVRLHLQYSCEVWSPSTKELKHRLEMVQRHAARFVTLPPLKPPCPLSNKPSLSLKHMYPPGVGGLFELL